MTPTRIHTSGLSVLRASRFTRFFVVPLTLLALFSGCHSWVTQTQSPVNYISAKAPAEVRLHLKDGRRVVVEDPIATETTISGTADDSLVTISLEEIEQLERRRFDIVGTAGLTLGILAVGVAAGVAFAASWESSGLGGSGSMWKVPGTYRR